MEIGRVFPPPTSDWSATVRSSAAARMEISVLSGEFASPEQVLIQQLQPDLIEVGDPYQLAWAALRVLRSPSLVYTVRSQWRRRMSCAWNDLLCQALQQNPLLRIGLHPDDANHPGIVQHYKKLIVAALQSRQAMTKTVFVNAYCAEFG